jgi:hypothetical protein
MPLQRVMADFGADHAFGQVPKKLKEHYGIVVPISTVAKATAHHGQQMQRQREMAVLSPTLGCVQQIAEIDGCMPPIVSARADAGDKRKNKKLHWLEARLALVHEHGSVTPKFEATFAGSVDDAGLALLNCAVAAGFGTQTRVHTQSCGYKWRGRWRALDSRPDQGQVWHTGQLSGGFFPCLRILGSRLKNLCARQPSGLDRKPEEPFEKQRPYNRYREFNRSSGNRRHPKRKSTGAGVPPILK